MKRLLPLIAFIATIFYSADTNAQNAPEKVRAVVDKLFDGMRAGDSLALKSIFLKEAVLTSVSKGANDSTKTHTSGIAGFVKAAGTAHAEKWDEKIYDVKISIDGPMAIVWAPYKFFLGEKFSHCGVNVFTMINRAKEWKILSITDTRRKDQCP